MDQEGAPQEEADCQSELEQLSHRLVQHGFRTRPAPCFAEGGVCAFTSVTSALVGAVMEKTVFLHASPDGWRARITRHGGPDWTRAAESISDLERVTLEALRATETPPSAAWTAE